MFWAISRRTRAPPHRPPCCSCPRCGFEPPKSACDGDAIKEHLRTCTDANAHAKHAATQKALEEKASAKAAREDAQAEAQNEASWKFLGGSAQQAWLLTDKQL